MKNILYVGILLIGTSNLAAQSKLKSEHNSINNKELLLEIKDTNFLSFLNNFYNISFPINYKKEIQRVENGELKMEELKSYEATQFLKIPQDDLIYFQEKYNYDTDERTLIKKENLPVYQFKFLTKKFIGLCIRGISGRLGDTTFVSLYVLDYKGNVIDKIVIGEQFTPESDWISSAFIDPFHFKVFKYEINWENYKKENSSYSIIDEAAPKTSVLVVDYEIEENGKIKITKEYPKRYLKNDIIEYQEYKPESDDIMNVN